VTQSDGHFSKLTRRGLLGGVAAGSAAACTPKSAKRLTAQNTSVIAHFEHGIASGDPSAESVILWTRVTPDTAESIEMEVTWDVSTTQDFAELINSGTLITNAARDWTVKANAKGLEAGTTYYYRFLSTPMTILHAKTILTRFYIWVIIIMNMAMTPLSIAKPRSWGAYMIPPMKSLH